MLGVNICNRNAGLDMRPDSDQGEVHAAGRVLRTVTYICDRTVNWDDDQCDRTSNTDGGLHMRPDDYLGR